MSSSEKTFLSRLLETRKQVFSYEDLSLRTKARACVPFENLVMQAKSKCPEKADNKLFRDLFLIELLEWFKQDFFKWFSSAYCNSCNQPMVSNGYCTPNNEDLKYGAKTVESYTCKLCGAVERFPRYNDPGYYTNQRLNEVFIV